MGFIYSLESIFSKINEMNTMSIKIEGENVSTNNKLFVFCYL